MLLSLLAALGGLVLAAFLRRGLARPGRNARRGPTPRTCPCPTMVVLGSGGHTSEMIALLEGMDGKRYSPVGFVVADTDTSSLVRLEKAESVLKGAERHVYFIPRSREVKQRWPSTVLSSIKALFSATRLVFNVRPELILVNGPGTCVPVCVAGVLLRSCGLGNPTIVFVESICRVHSLSLTGRILYPFADRFIVQWEELKNLYAASHPRIELLANVF